MRKRMNLFDKAVLAFEKLALVFSCAVSTAVVLLLIAAALMAWQVWNNLPEFEMPDSPETLRDDVACGTIIDLQEIIEDLDNAVIVQTIHINQEIPVVFDVPLDKNTVVQLTEDVSLENRPTTMNLPGDGGTINGWVNLILPRGYRLPVHLDMTVPVSHSLPVEVDVPVSIPLRDTDLGPIFGKLKGLTEPYTLYLNDALNCPSQ